VRGVGLLALAHLIAVAFVWWEFWREWRRSDRTSPSSAFLD
jgi:hypothetical protein